MIQTAEEGWEMNKINTILILCLIALHTITGCATLSGQPENAETRTEAETRIEQVKEKLHETQQKLDAAADKYFPQVPEKHLGKSMPGVRVGYAYDFIRQPDTHHHVLLKIPMCLEKRDEIISYTDRASNAAGVAAVLATPLVLSFPVLVDPVYFIDKGMAKSRIKTIEKTGTLTTGRAMLCGEKEPAPGETLIVQSAEDMELIYLQTDRQGKFSLKDIFSKAGDSSSLNIFIRQEGSAYYLTTIFAE
ncbi:MAG: hypothetical protein C4522_10060 [Desulfobacteraceae bacterium]|nr:MAG: hypothetical protein C4522_10060 [Desulfobacteraceae bacterium]